VGAQGPSGETGPQGPPGSGIAAGADSQIQYNRSNNFAASDNLVYDYTNIRLGVNESTPKSTLDVRGGVSFNYKLVDNVNYNAQNTDCFIGVKTNTTTVTITLHQVSQAAPGQLIVITDQSGTAGTNSITIQPWAQFPFHDRINNDTSPITISSNYGSVTMYAAGINSWFITASR
jgi:hypothetical protein